MEMTHVELQQIQINDTNGRIPRSAVPDENVKSVVSDMNGQISELDPDTAHAVIEMADRQLQQMEINDNNPLPLGHVVPDDNGEISHPEAAAHTVIESNPLGDIVPDENGEISHPEAVDHTGIESNADHGNDLGHIESISTLFAVSHGAILTAVASMNGHTVSSVERKNTVVLSAVVSIALIVALVVIFFQGFRLKRGGRPLRNSLVANRWWVTKRIAIVVMFMMLALCLLFSCNWLLKVPHH
jgi:hypothetical protein